MKLILSMLAIVSILIGALLLALPAHAEPPKTLTLADAYERALNQSEAMQMTVEDIRLADAQYREALSAIFPKVTVNASQRFRNENSSSAFNNGVGFSQGGFSGGGTHSFSMGANLTQPLFHGFKDFMVFYAAQAEYHARNLNSQRFRETLYQNVAEAFYQVALYQGEVRELHAAYGSLDKRIGELNDFQKLGKSRPSEVDAANVELAEARAAESRSRGFLTASKEALAFFVGLPAAEFEIAQTPSSAAALGQIEDYLSRARSRLDLQAADDMVESGKYQLKAAQRERWPGLDLEGNYYGVEDPDSGRDWDMLVQMKMPIFDGGKISSQVEQQRSRLRSAKLQRDELIRSSERDVRTAYENVLSAQRTAAALTHSVSASEANLKAQKHDYELGVVNNVDVLKAIQQNSDTRRELLIAQVNAQINRARLEVAAGGIAK